MIKVYVECACCEELVEYDKAIATADGLFVCSEDCLCKWESYDPELEWAMMEVKL